MPFYKFINKNTKEEITELLKISELDEYISAHPELEILPASPMIVSGRGMKKPDNAFRDVLKEIKKKNSRGITKSNINTF